MAWKKNGAPFVTKVTKDLAVEWANLPQINQERALSESRLGAYRAFREMGLMRNISWAKAYCKETKETYRINGQHTSTLFSDGLYLDDMYVTIEDFVCDTLEDVSKLWATFDSNVSARNAADINRAFASVIPDLKDYSDKFINLAVGALSFMPTRGEGGSSRGSNARRAEKLIDSREFCVWLHELIGDNPNSFGYMTTCNQGLWRVPVIAAIYSTYLRNRQAAAKFWFAVRDGSGSIASLPDRMLGQFLITSRSRVGNGKGSISSREYYVKCIHAWNAWMEGKPTKLRYVATADIPSVRTKFTNKR